MGSGFRTFRSQVKVVRFDSCNPTCKLLSPIRRLNPHQCGQSVSTMGSGLEVYLITNSDDKFTTSDGRATTGGVPFPPPRSLEGLGRQAMPMVPEANNKCNWQPRCVLPRKATQHGCLQRDGMHLQCTCSHICTVIIYAMPYVYL